MTNAFVARAATRAQKASQNLVCQPQFCPINHSLTIPQKPCPHALTHIGIPFQHSITFLTKHFSHSQSTSHTSPTPQLTNQPTNHPPSHLPNRPSNYPHNPLSQPSPSRHTSRLHGSTSTHPMLNPLTSQGAQLEKVMQSLCLEPRNPKLS